MCNISDGVCACSYWPLPWCVCSYSPPPQANRALVMLRRYRDLATGNHSDLISSEMVFWSVTH
jgi:hypothetical protein